MVDVPVSYVSLRSHSELNGKTQTPRTQRKNLDPKIFKKNVGVSKNRSFPPKSSILIGFSIINHYKVSKNNKSLGGVEDSGFFL